MLDSPTAGRWATKKWSVLSRKLTEFGKMENLINALKIRELQLDAMSHYICSMPYVRC